MGARPSQLLLVAHSARMLAQSAVLGGWRPFVVDLFGDEDTRQLAARCIKLTMVREGFDTDALRAAVGELVREHPDIGLIYGSGLENEANLVTELCDETTLIGNNPATLARVKDPKRFFSLLRELAIPFPEVRFQPPNDSGEWLCKSAKGYGGETVLLASRRSECSEPYYQRRVSGADHSILFLADGENAQIIGFNSQWVTSHDSDRPYRFSGIINRSHLSREQRATVRGYVNKLVRIVSLRGLNSLDFIRCGATCLVLEVNPRPSASMALYDKDVPKGLVDAHIAACQGELCRVRVSIPESPVRACQVVYARDDLVVPRIVDWPEWCTDRPASGMVILRGQPLCCVRASGEGETQVMDQIRSRAESVLQWFCGMREMA